MEYAFNNAGLNKQAELFADQTKYYPTHNVEIMLYKLGFKYYLKSDFQPLRGAVGVMARGPFTIGKNKVVNDHAYHIYVILKEVDNKYDSKMDNSKYDVIYTEKGKNVPTKGFWLPEFILPERRLLSPL